MKPGTQKEITHHRKELAAVPTETLRYHALRALADYELAITNEARRIHVFDALACLVEWVER